MSEVPYNQLRKEWSFSTFFFFLSFQLNNSNKVDMKENKLKSEAILEGRNHVPPSSLAYGIILFMESNQQEK